MSMDANIWGGAGDDFIRTGAKHTGTVTVKAGKGDDIIGETVRNEDDTMFGIHRRYEKDMDDMTIDKVAAGEVFEAYDMLGDIMNAEEKLYGEQGDDKIWLGGKVTGNAFAHGGSGDDTIYGGYKVMGDQFIYGNSGRDTIRTDWFSSRDDMALATGDEFIWGDYKYGADNLDKDLWGDADIIYGGKGDGSYYQKIYGGDGDDQIYQGFDWSKGVVLAGNGDDTITLGTDNIDDNIIFGGDGDDTWVNTMDSESRADFLGDEFYFGGEGNDYIATAHDSDGLTYVYGGKGHDIIVQGDNSDVGDYGWLVGNDGDDKIYGGDNN